jgi:predicted house-cleaning noncanonical NTP pyrophosphatase (MazG superfamily)/DNA-binding Xre family transcriptional regulator
MRWNLRLAAAHRGIWKASELQARLAERGLVISTGKMSGFWSGHPASVKLDDLDVICAVLDCGVEEVLIAEPDKVSPSVPDCEPQVSTGTGLIIRADGREPDLRRLDEQEYVRELHTKLLEEAAELASASNGQVAEELADVIEVVHAIARMNRISMDEVGDLAKRKRAERGAFEERWYLNS